MNENWNIWSYFCLNDLINPSIVLGFKFQLLRRMEGFCIYNTLKCIRDHTVQRGWQHMKS